MIALCICCRRQIRGAVFFCGRLPVNDAFSSLPNKDRELCEKYENAHSKPVNNLTLDIWKWVVHNDSRFMIFIESGRRKKR